MIKVRNVLVVLAVAFTAYLAARGLWWTAPVPYPLIVVATLALYLVTTWLCVFWSPTPSASANTPARVEAAADAADALTEDGRAPARMPVGQRPVTVLSLV